MARHERPVMSDDYRLQAFAQGLRELRLQAGNPQYRSLAKRAGYSASTLSEAANGRRRPTLDVVMAYVGACGGDLEAWRVRWRALDDNAPIQEDAGHVIGSKSVAEDGTAIPVVVALPAPREPGAKPEQPSGLRDSAANGAAGDERASVVRAKRRRPSVGVVVAAGGVVVAVAAGGAVLLGSDGGPPEPTKAGDARGAVTAFCNAGTLDIGVIHNHDGTYTEGDFDAVLRSNTCTTQAPIGWQYVTGFYVGPGFCMDVRIDGSSEGHRKKAGQWFFKHDVKATLNLNASHC